MEIIIATHNNHKLIEFKNRLTKVYKDAILLSLNDVNYSTEIDEIGYTFEQNSLIKAQTISLNFPNHIIIADDSGLEVEALNGAPGVYSSRYAEHEKEYNVDKDKANNNKLLKVMHNKYNKKAQFVTVLCVIIPGQLPIFIKGVVPGELLDYPRGENGFGYDPIFTNDGIKTFAELSMEEKEAISHRNNAIDVMIKKNILGVK